MTLIGILLVPVYVRKMGVEAYGLVGFFTMIQAWFQLLDMGLSPTMSRETARFNGDTEHAFGLRRLLRALEGVFFIVALFGAGAMIATSDLIAKKWLNVGKLPLDEVIFSLKLMAGVVAFRWACGLYRGAINGLEKMVWLSAFNIVIATLRFVLVIPLFVFVSARPAIFFGYQLGVAFVELLVLVIATYRFLPKLASREKLRWEWGPLKGALKFSLSVAFTSAVWILVTQTDKLVLSRILPLGEYAYFTLAVLVAGGINMAIGPISIALLPRLTKFSSANDTDRFVTLYRNTTQLVTLVAVPLALILVVFPEQVLFAWSGDAVMAKKAAGVLALYSAGNGFLAVAAFPYYLQFARGDLRLHLLGNAMFVAVLIPLLIWLAWHYGTIGAGYAWLGSNLIYFLLWVPVVHKHFVPGLHMKWLMQDVVVIVIATAVAAVAARELFTWHSGRIDVLFDLVMTGVGLMIVAIASSTFALGTAKKRWSNFSWSANAKR